MVKIGLGTLTFAGSTANTYTSPTVVDGGTLAFAMTTAVNAYGGPLLINGFYAPNTAPATVSLASNVGNRTEFRPTRAR